MEVQDDKNLMENYWLGVDNDDDEDDIELTTFGAKRLVEGIDIKDLCDGKEVIIKLAEDHNEDILNKEEEAFDEVIHCDPKTLREKRGAPPLNCKFRELANKMTNVTEDGLVKKQVITSGVGKIVPDKAYVSIHYNLYKENCEVPFDSTYMRNRVEKFRLGQGESILGLDYAIKSMRKNENSYFFIKWEVAYGALGCPDRIEPKCDIIADVTLVNFVETDSKDLVVENQELLDQMENFKKTMSQVKKMIYQGYFDFLCSDTKGAIATYKKVLRLLNSMRLADEVQEKMFLEKKVKTLVNLAICYHSLGKPEQVCLVCQEALSIDRNNVKANFLYGAANSALSNFKMAHEYLVRANRLKPNDEDINKELKKLNDKKALQQMAEKIFWKKAFEGKAKKEEGQEKEKEKEQEKDKEKEKEKGKENKKEVPCALDSFEKSLRESLEESLREKKPYVLPGPLLEDEKRICSRLANVMNLRFGMKEDFFMFSSKEESEAETSNN